MNAKKLKAVRRQARARAKIKGSKSRPRVSIFASAAGLYVQFIDDEAGLTLLAGRDNSKKGAKTERAGLLGKDLAEKAIDLGVKKVVFDRGQRKYHGRVAALASALRQGGLEF